MLIEKKIASKSKDKKVFGKKISTEKILHKKIKKKGKKLKNLGKKLVSEKRKKN